MKRASMPPDQDAERRDTPERTWADDIEAELPPILEALERSGAESLDAGTCARVLVLAGRARQISRPGEALEALATRTMPHVAALVARAPLPPPGRLLDQTDAILASEQAAFDGPLDALLDNDDWLTIHGLATHARLGMPHDPTAFGDEVGALVMLHPDRVSDLGPFAVARSEGMELRAHEAPAWEALLDMWSAVVEAPLHARVASLPAIVQDAATIESLTASVLSKFPVWAGLAEVEAPNSIFVRVYSRRPFFEAAAHARGLGLREVVVDPIEIGRWESCRLVLTGDGSENSLPILQLDGRAPDQTVAAEHDGEPLVFELDEFGAEVAEAPSGRYRVTVGGETIAFELRDHDESEGR